MKRLKKEQFDRRYFDGKQCDYACRAGYGLYNDRGFTNQAQWLVDHFDMAGKMVLDVGCAKGYLVHYLRELGVDAWGCDWSEYALSCADEVVKPFLFNCDATDVPGEWDWIISARLLICFPEKEVGKIAKRFNKHSANQLHFIDLTPNDKYYTAKPLEWWGKQGFAKGTVLIGDSWNNQLKV